jgi:MFS family permease
MAGLIVLAVSTTMFFMGNHVAILVVARILQGASGAFVWTSGTAFLSTRVGADATGAAMGWVTMGTAGGDLFGPIAGGVVFEHFGHFAVFALAATVISIDIILRLFLVDEALEMHTPYSSSTFRGEEEFTRLQESSTANLDHGGYGTQDQDTRQFFERDEGSSFENGGPSQNTSKFDSNLCDSTEDPVEQPGKSKYFLLLSDTDFLLSLWAILIISATRTALETVS